MWWQPDEFSEQVRADVDRLLGNYRRHVAGDDFRVHVFGDIAQPGAEGQLVWGLGSAPDEQGRWTRVLLLVSHEALLAEDYAVPVGQCTFEELFDRAAGSTLRGLLEEWGVPPSSVLQVTTRPMAAAGSVVSGDLVQEAAPGSRQATVGVPCQILATGEPAFLTAGHLVNGAGDRVDVAATGQGGQTWVRGVVTHWSDPATSGVGGYDYAVVRLTDPRDQMLSVVHGGPAGAPAPPVAPIDVSIYAAQSGPQVGLVSGALCELGDGARQWLACWQVAPSGLLAVGDSGSLVLGASGSSSGKVLGHFVGGSYWAGGPGLIHLYVQDLDSCLNSGLKNLINL
jgi:hypothetical protein